MLESTSPDPKDEKGPLSVRLSAEQREALEWHRRVFPERYSSVGAVLTDRSLNEAVAAYRRARELTQAAA